MRSEPGGRTAPWRAASPKPKFHYRASVEGPRDRRSQAILAQHFEPKSGKWPVVIWLHPHCYQYGWSAGRPWASTAWAYSEGQDARPSFPLLWQKGFAVFAFDQLGYGTRVHEARDFYPRWSMRGSMIEDTRAAIDALCALEEIDSSQISYHKR